MSRALPVVVACVLAVGMFAAAPGSASVDSPGSSTAELKGVTVTGAVGDRGPISRAALARFDQRAVRMTYRTSGGPQTHRYTGPLLLDVLRAVEPNFSSDRHDPLRYAILVQATDGFLSAIAWGEIDPELANKRAIVALTEDGKKLTRPRIVLPSDAHGARQVYDVASISLLRLSPEMAHGKAGRVLRDTPGHEHH
ncbi:molybdopterin-binding oxidoreductase [Sporichthya brevicatena]|uniref:Molybdopterin-binding oxidoreductase n=1 Tax=Sporichthya brevicatena TaxID=171442 RepID=A0ABN1H778_9ACTN